MLTQVNSACSDEGELHRAGRPRQAAPVSPNLAPSGALGCCPGARPPDMVDGDPGWPARANQITRVILDPTTQSAAAVGHAGTRMSAHCYRVVVEEELGPRYASAFDGMTLSAHDDRTEITGPIVDSSHLHGLLERIAGLGLTLRSLTRLIPRTRGLIAAAYPTSQGRRPRPWRKIEGTDMTFLWILLGIVYIACWVYFGLATFRNGHYWMFWIGFLIPILWISGP